MEKLGELSREPAESMAAPVLDLNPTPNPGLSAPLPLAP